MYVTYDIFTRLGCPSRSSPSAFLELERRGQLARPPWLIRGVLKVVPVYDSWQWNIGAKTRGVLPLPSLLARGHQFPPNYN